MQSRSRWIAPLGFLLFLLAAPYEAWAQDDTLNSGDTAWMLTASVLVLFMTIPGLSLFYAGLVRSKNVLSVMMQCFAITCMVTILWTLYAYGLAFGDGGALNAFVGMGNVMLSNVGVGHGGSGTIPESVFQMFQLTFAIITPALIVGAFAERMKFSAMLWFMGNLADPRLHAGRPLGLGRRLAGRARRPGLRRRHRRAHQRGHRRPRALHRARQAARLSRHARWRRTAWC